MHDKRIKKKCREAKEVMDEQRMCTEIEKAKYTSAEGMLKKIKAFNWNENKCTSSGCIEDKDGRIIVENMAIIKRWSEYTEELFQDDRGKQTRNLQKTQMDQRSYSLEVSICHQ